MTICLDPRSDEVSVMVRVCGDWTEKLKDLAISDEGPKIPFYFDGPFYSPTEDVFDYEVSIIVGSGIGITPFASVLNYIK